MRFCSVLAGPTWSCLGLHGHCRVCAADSNKVGRSKRSCSQYYATNVCVKYWRDDVFRWVVPFIFVFRQVFVAGQCNRDELACAMRCMKLLFSFGFARTLSLITICFGMFWCLEGPGKVVIFILRKGGHVSTPYLYCCMCSGCMDGSGSAA